jgi:hypothetical protein
MPGSEEVSSMKPMFKALIAVAALTALVALPIREAHAAKIPVIYQSGDEVFVAGDGSLPKPFDEDPQLKGAQAGYKCDVWGLFWAYASIKDCKAVAFKGDTYWEDAELSEAIAKAHPEASMKVGFWNAYGKFPLGLIVLGLIGVVVWSKLRGDDDDDDETEAEGEQKPPEA